MPVHPIAPVYNGRSKILILGSFPSVKSREQGFFYGHPKNRFWKVLSALFQEDPPTAVPEKRAFLLRHGIAVWDVIASCEISGSADSTIRAATPNDLSCILNAAPIRAVFVNGKTAQKYYDVYQRGATGKDAVLLPSTSPANAACSYEKLLAAWSAVLSYLKN